MFYKLLGYLVWNGGKVFLRTRYGSTYLSKPVLAGVAAATVGGIVLALVAGKRDSSD
jgi:hypothetical protein